MMPGYQHNRHAPTGLALEAITFDVTHTLIHSPSMAEIYCQALERHGMQAQVDDLRREIPWVWKEFSCQADPRYDRFARHTQGPKGWWQDFVERLCQRLDLPKPSRFLGAELFDRFAHAEAWEVYDDVEPALKELKDLGLQLAVVSNWDHRLPELLERLGLLGFFDQVVYSSAVGVEKPNAQIFRRCLQDLGVEAERTMHVGDQPIEDIEGALALGMQAVRVDRQEARVSLAELIRPMLQPRPSRAIVPSGGQKSDPGHHVLR